MIVHFIIKIDLKKKIQSSITARYLRSIGMVKVCIYIYIYLSTPLPFHSGSK
jgi:hypothetical protein